MLIKQLPDNWRSKNSGFTTDATTTRSTSPTSDKRAGNSNGNSNGVPSAPSASDLPRTPLHLLGQAARGGNLHKEPTSGDGDQDLDNVRRSRFGGSRQSLPW